MPIYDLGNVEGLPHKRSFVMVAKVGVVSMSGSGTSKKVLIDTYVFSKFYLRQNSDFTINDYCYNILEVCMYIDY